MSFLNRSAKHWPNDCPSSPAAIGAMTSPSPMFNASKPAVTLSSSVATA
ncbi:hypothetical protein [Mycolicibacterium austroafricanum]|nr:hypothetical protein [Mycolicibacterium austroafricanum]QZT62673.1 hypothetical protein JN085_28135 [Mycolicibacterium austroafricanum]